MSQLSEEQASRLQSDVQNELERREWAEPGDAVMSEYICVLLANGNSRDRVKAEMEDLIGSDFDTSFLDWLFSHHASLPESAPAPAAPTELLPESPASATAGSSAAASRMFASAMEGTKRKAEPAGDEQNKRRLPDRPLGAPPTGPRQMNIQGQAQQGQGRSLVDRLGPRGGGMGPQRGGMNGRGGMMNGRGGHMNGNNRQQFGFQQQGFPGMPVMPGQQEMMMQMMAMHANMAQMAEQMAKMSEGNNSQSRPGRPTRAAPAKVPAGTKLGGHSVSAIQPRGQIGEIPEKPTSTALCKFGVGCSNARCIYSHPSPVADEKTGMVLSEEPCEAGKDCKNPECVKSHISPAAVHGETAGSSRVLCKFQNCTNPACQFRHEDEAGNFIPPPALSKKVSMPSLPSGSEDGDPEVVVKAGLDAPLEDGTTQRPCRYGERCTRADCKFSHPASRPTPRGAKPTRGGAPKRAPGSDAIVGDMSKSSKFAKPLDPTAGEFKPADSGLEVTM